jgi:hypothetical protein
MTAAPGQELQFLNETSRTEAEMDQRILWSVPGTTPIAAVKPRQEVKVAGRVRSLTVKPWGDTASLQVELTDDLGTLKCAFLGRRQIAGVR